MTNNLAADDEARSRFRSNFRTLKALRDMTDTDIAEAGGFTSRQVLSGRVTGRTDPDITDLARIARAFKVDITVLLLPTRTDVVRWLDEHPDYGQPVKRARRR